MNRCTVILGKVTSHQRTHGGAMVSGLKKIGYTPSLIRDKKTFVRTKNVSCWGWRLGQRYREKGHEVLIMERGYVGDRFFYTSLGWNGLNGHARFPVYPDDNGARFHAHGGVLKPWKTDGDYALILGQVPGDMSLQGRDMVPWYEEMARKIKETHGLPVQFRPHPLAARKGGVATINGAEKSEGSLEDALSRAAFSVCFNSNSSVDSVLAGVPCIVGDRGSMAWDVCSHDVKEIIRPDREVWAHKLAFTQWSMAEIESGKPLRALFP